MFSTSLLFLVTPFLAKPFININFLNNPDKPYWLKEEYIKKSEIIFRSKIIVHPIYVVETIHKYNPSSIPQIAVVGKSNVGKSSLINALLNRKVAQTSKTPGRTRHLFIFDLLNYLSVVDLPGYGFAKVSKNLRNNWSIMIEEYFNRATNLKRVLILIDCTEFFSTYDFILLDMLITKRIPFQFVLTKIDKLKVEELHKLVMQLLAVIEDYKKKIYIYNEQLMKKNNNCYNENYEFNINEYIHNVSSLKHFGVKELQANLSLIALDHWNNKKRK